MVAPIKGIPMPNQVVSLEAAAQNIATPQDFKKKVTKKSKSARGEAKEKGDNGAEGRSNLLNLTSSANNPRKI